MFSICSAANVLLCFDSFSSIELISDTETLLMLILSEIRALVNQKVLLSLHMRTKEVQILLLVGLSLSLSMIRKYLLR